MNGYEMDYCAVKKEKKELGIQKEILKSYAMEVELKSPDTITISVLLFAPAMQAHTELCKQRAEGFCWN